MRSWWAKSGLYRKVPRTVCFESLFNLFTSREEVEEVLVGKVGAAPPSAPLDNFKPSTTQLLNMVYHALQLYNTSVRAFL